MTFNLISLGLNANSITAEALAAIKNSDKIYLENYTTDFPYSIKDLEKSLKVKIIELDREQIESEEIVDEAKSKDISLLVYGEALSATTHIQLISKCKKQKIQYKVFHNASVLTAISETGLQLYKFGKTASMPNWQEHKTKPTSFIQIIKQNQKINAHTLLLIDIGLTFEKAREQLKEVWKSKEEIIVCSKLGTDKSKIYYDNLDNLPKKIEAPFCFVIPSKFHFTEQESLNRVCKK